MALEPMGYTAANRRTIKLMVEQAAPLFEDGSAPMFMVMADAIVAIAVGKLFYAIAPAGAAYAGEKRLYLRTADAPYYADLGDAAAPVNKSTFGTQYLYSRETASSRAIDSSIKRVLLTEGFPAYYDEVGSVIYNLLPTLTRFMTANGRRFAMSGPEIMVDSCGNVATDFASAMEAACTAAWVLNGMVVLKPGATYTANRTVLLSNIGLRLRCNGARILRGPEMANNESLIILDHDFFAPQAVTSIAGTSISLDSTGSTTAVAAIGVADASAWKVGDVGRLVADNAIIGSVPGDNERVGESFRVSRVDAGIIYTCRPLRETFTTNIRVARYQRLDCIIEDLWCEDHPDAPISRNASMIQMLGIHKPTLIRPKIINARAAALRFMSCFEPCTMLARFENLRTSAAYEAYGYGIWEEGCCDGLHVNPRGSRLRHLFTTAAINGLTNNDARFNRYGGCIGATVIGGVATETEHSGFDTHADALDVTFKGCEVINAYRGEQGSLYAYKVRGRRILLQDCSSTGPGAVYLQAQEGGGDFEVVGHVHRTPKGWGASQVFGGANYGSGQARAFISARVVTEEHVGTFAGWTGFAIKGRFDVRWDIASTGNPRLFDLVNSSLDLSDLNIELTGSPSGTVLAGAYFNDAASLYRVSRMIMRANGKAFYYANYSPTSPGPGGFAASAIIARMETDLAPFGTSAGVINAGASSIYAANVIVNNGAGAQPSSFVVNLTVSYPQTVSLRGRGEDQIVLSLRANSETVATRDLSIGFPPVRVGQRLILLGQPVGISANQKPVTIKAGTYLPIAADLVVNAGEAVSLVSVQDSSLATPLYWARG